MSERGSRTTSRRSLRSKDRIRSLRVHDLQRERILVLAHAARAAPVARDHCDGPYPSVNAPLGVRISLISAVRERVVPIRERSGPSRPPRPRTMWHWPHVAFPQKSVSPFCALPRLSSSDAGPLERSEIRDDSPDLIRRRVSELRAWHVRSRNALHDGPEQLRIAAAASPLTGREIGPSQSFRVETVAARARQPEELLALVDRLCVSLNRVGGLTLLRKGHRWCQDDHERRRQPGHPAHGFLSAAAVSTTVCRPEGYHLRPFSASGTGATRRISSKKLKMKASLPDSRRRLRFWRLHDGDSLPVGWRSKPVNVPLAQR